MERVRGAEWRERFGVCTLTLKLAVPHFFLSFLKRVEDCVPEQPDSNGVPK